MRILFLCHGHPALQAGGTEIAAQALFRAMRERPGVDGLFVAATTLLHRPANPGTPFQAVGGEPDELLMRTEGFDRFMLSQTDLHGIAPEMEALLREQQPDIVHLHHPLLVGVEALHLVRRAVPAAKIVLTLHDYFAICANEGQMRTSAGQLCREASLDACRRCLPDRSATEFRLRELHIRSMYRLVDRFIAPSRFLRDRYIAWGIEPSRITVLANGLPPGKAVPHRTAAPGSRRDRFAFFGHINESKGSMVALAASALLTARGDAHLLTLHGGAPYQTDRFLAAFAQALREAPDARHAGAYGRDEIATRIADADWVVVPSVWWENAPLVIQEAFLHRRPVITSGVGGMAEAVRDGLTGLHAAPNDPHSLADAMARATDASLWAAMVKRLPAPMSAQAAADAHLALYQKLGAPARPTIAKPVEPKLRRAA